MKDPKMMREIVDVVTKNLVNEGKLIEAGWVGLRTLIPENAPQIQIEEMRNAFFAGAQHLWGSLMTFLDEGQAPTNADLRRMDLIHKELEEFIAKYKQSKFT